MTLSYPPPEKNPACQCQGSPLSAFFCSHGHMLECHFPYACQDAGCSHLARYGFPPEELTRLEGEALERLKAGAMPPYEIDEQGCIRVNLEKWQQMTDHTEEVAHVEENESWCDGTDDIA